MSRRLNTMLSRRWAGNSGGDPSVIYELYNYICDGTAATAIDTGIKLFDTTAFPKGFIIEMTATSSTFTSQGSFLRCRGANSPYPGCCIRWSTTSGTIQMQMNGDSKTKGSLLGTTVDYVIGYYPGAMGFWGINNDVSTFSAKTISTNDTLCIGGEKDANGNWKSGRYATATIHSVKIIDLAALIDDNDYPYFEAMEANSTVGMTLTGTAAPVLYYSTDKSNWTLWDYSNINLTNVGDRVYFYGTSSGLATADANYSTFTGSGSLKLGGLLTRLINNPILVIPERAFQKVFENCTALVSAESASFGWIKVVNNHSLSGMFTGCTALANIPKIAFEKTSTGSLANMFRYCAVVSVSNIGVRCVSGTDSLKSMFEGCTSLVSADIICRTPTSGDYVYGSMFEGCTSLVVPPTITGDTLSSWNVFNRMFYGCISLERAPELPLSVLKQGSYARLFQNCTSLKYVKCLATDISAYYCTSDWLKGVSPTGTFVKAPGVSWPSGNSGIPDGWTVIEATE